MADKAACFFSNFQTYDLDAAAKFLIPEVVPVFEMLSSQLIELKEWSAEAIHAILQDCLTHFKLKLPQLAQPLRVALTGTTNSPSIDVTIYLIGKERALELINKAMKAM